MSDHLRQAVQAEMAAHEPGPGPSFDSLLDRKRSRDRRRGGAALAATALAVAGVALVPSALGGGSPAPAAQGGGADQRFSYHVTASGPEATDRTSQDALRRCLSLPGLSDGMTLDSYPQQHTGTVTGRDQVEALKACVDAVPGRSVTLGTRAVGESRTYTVRPAVRAVLNSSLDEQRDACFALPGVEAVSVQESLPATYRVTVPAAEAEPFERCISAVSGLYVPEVGQQPANDRVTWTGGQVCAVGPMEDCRRLTGAQARALDAVLARAEPAPSGTAYCEAASTLYRVMFEHPSVRAIASEVPYRCGPMRRAGQDFLLDQDARDAVKAAFEAGSQATSRPPVRSQRR